MQSSTSSKISRSSYFFKASNDFLCLKNGPTHDIRPFFFILKKVRTAETLSNGICKWLREPWSVVWYPVDNGKIYGCWFSITFYNWSTQAPSPRHGRPCIWDCSTINYQKILKFAQIWKVHLRTWTLSLNENGLMIIAPRKRKFISTLCLCARGEIHCR